MQNIFNVIILIIIFAVFCFVVYIRKYFRKDEYTLDLSKNKYFERDANSLDIVRKIIFFNGLLVMIIWMIWHVMGFINGVSIEFKLIFTIAGIVYFLGYFASFLYHPYPEKTDGTEYNVCVLIPVFNEEVEDLKESILSILNQTRKPNQIHIVDDGSESDFSGLEVFFNEKCKEYEIEDYSWTRQENSGKRAAQAKGFSKIIKRNKTIIVTVDSDCILSPLAFENGVKPFVNEDVKSVAGFVFCANIHNSLLVKLSELIFASQQVIDREFMSLFGSVPVNSGALAFYCYSVFENAISNKYLDEKFNSTRVEFSDDSYLTMFALQEGRAVFQTNSRVYAKMPENMRGFIKQQLRWNRGAFIRGFWRTKYSKIDSWIFFKQVYSWLFLLMYLTVLTYILFFSISSVYQVAIYIITPSVIFGFISSIRYLQSGREDITLKEKIWMVLIYTLPSIVLYSVVLRVVRIFAILTVNKRGWGTRQLTTEEE